MTSKQKYVNPKTVELLLRIATSRATTRTSPKTILSLDEDSLLKVVETYSKMVNKAKITEKYIKTLPDNIDDRQIIIEKKHKREGKRN